MAFAIGATDPPLAASRIRFPGSIGALWLNLSAVPIPIVTECFPRGVIRRLRLILVKRAGEDYTGNVRFW